MINFDRTKSLEQLEHDPWIESDSDSSLTKKCRMLRKLPLTELNIESFRILIGQNIGLQYLIPLAIEELKKNPLAEGDFYEGDLLCNVLRVDKSFWVDNKDLVFELRKIILYTEKSLDNLSVDIKNSIQNAINVFKMNVG